MRVADAPARHGSPGSCASGRHTGLEHRPQSGLLRGDATLAARPTHRAGLRPGLRPAPCRSATPGASLPKQTGRFASHPNQAPHPKSRSSRAREEATARDQPGASLPTQETDTVKTGTAMNRAGPNRQTGKARLVRLHITRRYPTPLKGPAACGEDARRWPFQTTVSGNAALCNRARGAPFRVAPGGRVAT